MEKHLQCRQKIVAWDFNPPDFEGFGGKVGLGQDIKRLADGDLLLVFHAGYWHMSLATPWDIPQEDVNKYIANGFRSNHKAPNGGRIMGMRSSDDGLTWSKPFDILVQPTDVGPQGLNVLNDGTVLIFVNNQASWYGYDKAPAGHMKLNTRTGIICSTDNGKTWSESVWFDCPYDFYERGFCNSIQLPDGSLLYATYCMSSASKQLFGAIHKSIDKGQTWECISTIERSDGKNIDEPAIALLPSGKIILLTRPDGAIFYSQDQGRTWEYSHKPAWDDADPNRTTDKVKSPRLIVLDDGTLVCYFTGHGVLAVSWSTDEGLTWHNEADGKPYLLDPDAYGYPGGCLMKDGSVFVVYYDATHKQQRTIVWGIRLKINDARDSFEVLPAPGVKEPGKIDDAAKTKGTLDVDVM
ncbi:MAG: sialidase family protein [Planctomycetota bacterium]